MKPEERLKNRINKYLKDLKESGVKLHFEKRHPTGFSYKKGMPDFYILYKGIHFEVEIKAPDGKRTTMQEKYEGILKDAGAVYWLINSFTEFHNNFLEVLHILAEKQ